MSATVVYLSGPISLGGKCSAADIAVFTDLFREAEEIWEAAGFLVVNPCSVPQQASWEAYMRHGMRAVADADVVAVLPRWQESRGATLEAFVATQLGIPVVDAFAAIEDGVLTPPEGVQPGGDRT